MIVGLRRTQLSLRCAAHKRGDKVNVQDGAVIHYAYLKYPTTVKNNVSIGHKAIVHGCTIEDSVLTKTLG